MTSKEYLKEIGSTLKKEFPMFNIVLADYSCPRLFVTNQEETYKISVHIIFTGEQGKTKVHIEYITLLDTMEFPPIDNEDLSLLKFPFGYGCAVRSDSRIKSNHDILESSILSGDLETIMTCLKLRS